MKGSLKYFPLGAPLYVGIGILLLLGIFMPRAANAMTVRGPIVASSVTVSGDVSVDSMTVSSITIASRINVAGTYSGMAGRVVQMTFSSSTATTTVSTTTFTAVPDISQSITLSNAKHYVRISLTGGFHYDATSASNKSGYLTIYRDSTNLGDASVGLVSSLGYGNGYPADSQRPGSNPVGITIIDSPGDTNTHTYKAYIRSEYSGNIAGFPDYGTGYLLLEEISQ